MKTPAQTNKKISVNLSMLVAYSKNRVIGSDGKIPWNLPSERFRFKQICNGKKIIMGRKSFEEIGHGLSYCTIIVVSKTLTNVSEGCILCHSLEEAIELCQSDEILVAGGEEIYRQTLSLCSKIYATEIEQFFEGNSFFPEIPDFEKKWDVLEEGRHEENQISYRYLTFTRKHPH